MSNTTLKIPHYTYYSTGNSNNYDKSNNKNINYYDNNNHN